MVLPETIDGVIAELEKLLIHFSEQHDRRAYFIALYLKVTQEVRNKLKEDYFQNKELMEELDIVFANRFLEAIYNYDNKEPVTNSWQMAFSAANKWRPLVIQHLFLGMNAHIALDLGIAAATVAHGKDIESLNADFRAINSILSSLINNVQENLSAIWPLLKPIDWLAGRIDEDFTAFSMEIARDSAWKVAQEYHILQSRIEQINYIEARDKKVETYSRKIIYPGRLVSSIASIIRIGETGTIKSKIRKLML
jgi:hypothetical protein